MTTYAPIADSEIDAESPITDLLLARFRDNPIAMFEGETGAPRLRGLACMTYAEYLNIFPFTEVSAGEFIIDPIAYSGSFGTQFDASGTTYVQSDPVTITSKATGTLRFRAVTESQGSSSPSSGNIRLLKNGVVVATIAVAADGADRSRAIDAAAAVGDVFRWEVNKTGGNFVVRMKDFSIRCNDEIIFRGAPIKRSQL